MFETANIGSKASVEVDNLHHFSSFFVGFRCVVDLLKEVGFSTFAVDACFTKHTLFRGWMIMILVGRLSTGRIVLVSCMICRSESKESWKLFAEKNEALGTLELFANKDSPFENRREPNNVANAKYAEKEIEALLNGTFGGELPLI